MTCTTDLDHTIGSPSHLKTSIQAQHFWHRLLVYPLRLLLKFGMRSLLGVSLLENNLVDVNVDRKDEGADILLHDGV